MIPKVATGVLRQRASSVLRSCPVTSPARITDRCFYRSYVTLRSSARTSPGKHGIRVIAARISTTLLGDRAKKCLHGGQNILHDHIDAFRGRMDAVPLVEPDITGDAFQEKWIQRHAKRLGEIRIDRV